ncbi:hypothetical protein ELI24_17470 [Rhizobium ruizarguesonis]|uniref:hypothetical protein n=1 Tax=Rhizobium ruizarguesonis TaxID=2081791 RepID=UPI0010324830|nr:hypothetical protein [Rhizobium ruizarguesonis]TAW00051.1 hypothetical protein ELI24_17470 [Rhizobium ruizarguesonis]TAW17384.1 hypothetical protein ELI25_16915 [Rhizobium ruizarguesonis]TAZ52910.1 hypothetical protein ELH76_17920 [Rhizobium ruizarguesonis]
MEEYEESVESSAVILTKEDEGLVFDARKADGSPFTEEDYQASRRETSADRAAVPSIYKICAEGDSWINILWPLSSVQGYNESFVDIIENDGRVSINNIGWPGDTFESIVAREQFRVPIQSGIYDFFILSGGGNDFLGGGSLVKFIKPFASVPASADPEDYIDKASLTDIFAEVKRGYVSIINKVSVWSPHTEILLQGYDYAIPRPGGQWMGTPFANLGYSVADPLPARIIRLVVDEFYALLDEVRQVRPRVHVMNNRNQLQGHWHDELHPDKVAATRVGNAYIDEMFRLRPIA